MSTLTTKTADAILSDEMERRYGKQSEVDAAFFKALRLYTDELGSLRKMRAGLEALHVDLQRWLTESEDRPNLRAAACRVHILLGLPVVVSKEEC